MILGLGLNVSDKPKESQEDKNLFETLGKYIEDDNLSEIKEAIEKKHKIQRIGL